MKFIRTLSKLATIPAHSGREGLVQQEIYTHLIEKTDDQTTDDAKNLYAVREGKKKGMIMFCAHMDKRMEGNWVADIHTNSRLETSVEFGRLPSRNFIDNVAFWYVDSGLYSPLDNAQMIPDSRTSPIKGDIDTCGFFDQVYALKHVSKKNGHYVGKFDDALGLTLMLDLMYNTSPKDTPDILFTFTVQEEVGSKGAAHSAKCLDRYYGPNEIIVLDTTSAMRPSEGIVLYKNCDQKFKKSKGRASKLEKKIQNLAKKSKTLLHTVDARKNDSRAFGVLTDIPTVALEVPIENMHGPIERVSPLDIKDMQKFLKAYVTTWSK